MDWKDSFNTADIITFKSTVTPWEVRKVDYGGWLPVVYKEVVRSCEWCDQLLEEDMAPRQQSVTLAEHYGALLSAG